MRRLCETLGRLNMSVCGVYCLESQFIEDKSKYFSGVLSAMSAMVNLEIPHVNVMTKMDLIEGDYGNRVVEEEEEDVDDDSETAAEKKRPIVQLIDDYSMVRFIPLNITDEDSVEYVLSHVDNSMQYGEDLEPKEPDDVREYDE
ncbi:unnamed protein product [Mucor hiemalis]